MVAIEQVRSKRIGARLKRYFLNRFGSVDRWYKVRMLRKSVPYRSLEVAKRDYANEIKGREQDFEAYFR
jgi:hypothetical protein